MILRSFDPTKKRTDHEYTIPQNIDKSSIVDQKQFDAEIQKYYQGHNVNSKKTERTPGRIQKVIQTIDDYNIAKSKGKRPTNSQYYYAHKYDVIVVDGQKVLVHKKKDSAGPAVQVIPAEDYYDKIFDAHISTGHGRREKIVEVLKNKYLIPRFAVQIFISLCKICLEKKSLQNEVREVEIANVSEPVDVEGFNTRGQIDIIDMQSSPDGEYKWLLLYQDISTKFCFLRPLKTNNAVEVAIEVLKIFLEVGCPYILQSSSGREFTASVIDRLTILWPTVKVVHGRVCNSRITSKCSMEHIKSMVLGWMADKKSTSWSLACYFVQLQSNSYNFTFKKTPFKALFGVNPKLGLFSSCLPKDVVRELESEEDLMRVLRLNEGEHQEAKVLKDKTYTLETRNEIFFDEYKSDDDGDTLLSLTEEIDIKPEAIPTIDDPISDATSLETVIKEEFIENDNQEVKSDMLPVIETDVKIEQSLICEICKSETSPASHTCVNCQKVIHSMCGEVSEDVDGYLSKLICNDCVSKRQEQTQLKSSSLKRPSNTKEAFSKKFKENNASFSVLIAAAETTESVDTSNLTENVLTKNNKLYIVGTAAEIFSNILPQKSSTTASQVTLPIATVASVELTPQIKYKCFCRSSQKGKCTQNICFCKRVNRLCNVHCHRSSKCGNK